MGKGSHVNKNKNVSEWSHGSTFRVNRLRDRYRSYVPSVDIDRAAAYTESYRATEAEDIIIRRAKALKRALETKSVTIFPDELIVGTRGSQPRSAELCPDISWKWILTELDTMCERPQDPYLITADQKRLLRTELLPYWEGRSVEEYYLASLDEETKKLAVGTNIISSCSKSLYGPGETAPGFEDILKHGFKGVSQRALRHLGDLDIADATTYDGRQFLRAVIICCEAMRVLGERYSAEALRLSMREPDHERKRELERIAEICSRVPWNAPRTFWEALQAVHLIQLALWTEQNCSSVCPGRMDQYLYEFYVADVASGRLTSAQALELVECSWLKQAEFVWALDEASAQFFAGYQPYSGVTVGGVDRNGHDATNDLSHMMIQASIDVRLHIPSLNARVHENSPDDFLMHAAELVALGTGMPAMFFDPTAIGIMEKWGASLEDARDWCVAGCVEPSIPGKMARWAEGNRYSYATAVDWALTRGYSRVMEEQFGPDTGDPESFATFDDFERAVKAQLSFIIRHAVIDTQAVERAHRSRLPLPLLSCCFEDCVSTSRDVTQGGARYNAGPGIETTGIADLADSMEAVRHLVFEERAVSMRELLEALRDDFCDHDGLRQMLIGGASKYGNDIDSVDSLAASMLAFAVSETERFHGALGSPFRDGLVPVIANVPHGKAIWALPSGRGAREPLADGISPYMGYDRNGPTSVIKSACRIDHVEHMATLLNLKLNPDLVSDELGRRNLVALLRTALVLGAYHVQFNVVSAETLREAKARPSEYRDLLVRVAGYSAHFVELSDEMQDVLISRTEQMTW